MTNLKRVSIKLGHHKSSAIISNYVNIKFGFKKCNTQTNRK